MNEGEVAFVGIASPTRLIQFQRTQKHTNKQTLIHKVLLLYLVYILQCLL